MEEKAPLGKPVLYGPNGETTVDGLKNSQLWHLWAEEMIEDIQGLQHQAGQLKRSLRDRRKEIDELERDAGQLRLTAMTQTGEARRWKELHRQAILALQNLQENHIDLAEETALREKLANILRRTANALHGGPLPNGLWSFHDLPELATKLKEEKK